MMEISHYIGIYSIVKILSKDLFFLIFTPDTLSPLLNYVEQKPSS